MYSTGTLSLTNGSTTVTGAGTAWVAALRPGWLILIPSEAPLLVEAVNSDTSLSLARPYQGTTRAGVVYNAVPTRGELQTFVTQLQAVISGMQATIDGAGAGKFPDGSAALPGVRFSADEDSGLRRKAANALALVTGGADRLEITNAGAVLTGLLTGTAVTQSAIDATVGRLLKVGDFGLGTALTLGPGDNLDALTASGFYYNSTAGNTAGNNYPIASAGALLNMRRSATNWVQQYTAYPANSLAGDFQVFTRSYGGAGWSPWVEIFHQGRIVGTVSQAAGVPTGRVIERGSNANGSYVRFADGTQICSNIVTIADLTISVGFFGGFRSAGQSWTFPAAFSSAPTMSGYPSQGSAFGMVSHGTVSATAGQYAFTAIAAQAAAARVGHLSAIGRWF